MEHAWDVEAKRPYSLGCERHGSPKNSKWLQDNLTDMDNKIKAMIRLIEEDADSFARRAEMYYKKRPDLMKLVEEFYRAYRALAERYDRVTGALRQAHRTISVAFPDQIQLMLPDEPPSGSFDNADEETSESGSTTQSTTIHWDGKSLDAIAPLIIEEGLKHFNCLFTDEEAQKKFGESLVMKILEFKEDEDKDLNCKLLVEETEKFSKEKKDLQDRITMESLRADNAQAELQSLKDAISKLKSELEAAVARYQFSQNTISNLESQISERQEKNQHLSDEMRIKTSKLNMSEERCLGLERKNTLLNLELDKLNRVVTRQQEEALDCLKENKDLQIRFDSESKRADQAEADSIKLRDVISKLKSEMESALLQYHVSQEKISELEAEILRIKEQFKSVCADMSTEASKLNVAEEQCLLLQEENKSLRDELEKFRKRAASQEEMITRREEELYKLQHSLEEECHRNMCAEIKEKSLQLQIDKLEKTVLKQEEEFATREKELDKLSKVIHDESKQRLNIERTHQSLVKLHAQYEEKMELLCLEVQNITEKLGRVETKAIIEEERHHHAENNGVNEESYSSVSKIENLQDKITSLYLLVQKLEDELRYYEDKNVFHLQELSNVKNEKQDLSEARHELTDKLRRMELREAGMEKEMRHLHDENRSLNEKKFSSLSKIVCLQDEIISSRDSKYRLEDELKFQEEEKKVLQQEILSLKNERNALEERHNEIVAQIEEVNFNVISLQAEVKEMHDGNKKLQDACKRCDDEKDVHMGQLRLMDNIMEKYAVLKKFLSAANSELQIFLANNEGLEEYYNSLHGIILSHMSMKPGMVSHVKAIPQNMEKLTEKNALLENLISDLNVEFDVLRRKVKTLEQSCQSLYCQKSFLIDGNCNLVSQVERVCLHLQSLENRFISEDAHINVEDKDSFQHIEQLHCPPRPSKEEHHDHVCSFKNQISYLNNQIHLLREENNILKEELDEEQHKSIQNDISRFIVEQCLTDLNEKNLFLLEECRKYMDESERAKKIFLEFKEQWASQENSLASSPNCNEKLLKGIHVMMENDTKQACESSKNASYNMFHLILHRIADLQTSILVTKDETLTTQEILFLQTKNHEILELNEQLWKDLNTSRQHEEILNIELEFLSGRLSDLQEANRACECEIMKLLVENEFLSQRLCELRERSSALEMENATILENAITQEHLSVIFSNSNAEKALEVEWLIKDVEYLYRITNDLGQEIRVVNKSMRALEAENMHMKEEFKTHIGLLEDKIHKARSAFGRLNIETDAGKQLLEQREKQPFNTENKSQGFQSVVIPIKFEEPLDEIREANSVREELEKYLSSFSENNACKNHDIGFQYQSNEKLREELHKLQVVVEKLRTRESNLTSELQIATEKHSFCNEESVRLLDELHAASIMELIFKEKLIEIMQTARCLETTDIVQLKMPTEGAALREVLEDYKGKFVSLDRENKRMKAELNAYVPLVASLENEVASLEEKTIAVTNLHVLNSKRKQGNLLTSLKHKKSIQMRGQHSSPRASAGIMELKKLRGKVKVLQKAVTDAERDLEEERVPPEANVRFSTTKSKGRMTNRSTRLVEAQKDIILDLRKGVDAGNDSNDSILLKDDDMLSREKHVQMMKDIELDHVLSSYGLEPSFSVEKDHFALEVWEPGTDKNVQYDNIGKVDEGRSDKPSDELVLQKEPSVDNLVYPAGCTESLQAWIKWINCSVSADARRLVVLQDCLKELKSSIQASEMKCQPPASELSAIKSGVKEAEGAIRKLIDFNYKLSRMAEDFSLSSDSKKSRRKALEQIQSASEKITALGLKLQKLHCFLSDLQEGKQESKAAKGSLERRSRIPLKDLIYGKRGDLRQKKRPFCACMRLKRTDSNLT